MYQVCHHHNSLANLFYFGVSIYCVAEKFWMNMMGPIVTLTFLEASL